MMEYRALPIQNASDIVIKQKLQKLVVTAHNRMESSAYWYSFNSEGMYGAYVDAEGKPVVEIYK